LKLTAAASARPLEILLVEDNPGDVRLVVEALRHGKLLHRLSVAENGAKALAMLRREGTHAHRAGPDLILLDLNLPGLSGHELLAELKSDPLLARIPVVVMTGSDAQDDIARAYASHANCYVRKPVDIDRLLTIVHGIGHFWLSVVSLPEHATEDDRETWRLLLVEDNPGDARLVRETLGDAEISIVHVTRLADAIDEMAAKPFTVALVDPGLPDSQGIDTISAMLRAAPLMPLVVLSGRDDEDLALHAIQLGAQDYVVKGTIHAESLVRGLRYAVERKLVQERLDYLATHDGVTGLPNRQSFLEDLNAAVAQCHRRASDAVLLLISISGLSQVNRLYGHDFGDLAIDCVVKRLKELLPADARLACTGSVELSIILSDTQSIMDTPQLAEKIIAAASLPGVIGSQTFYLGANVGVSLFSIDSEDPSALLKCAETALYQARTAGPTTFRFYSAQLNATAMEQLTIEHELREALDRDEFRLHYQPVFDVASHELLGAEALLRWQHPQRGLLAPESFLEVAEKRGLMPGIGAWAIAEACRMARSWQQALGRPLRIAVNVSAHQLVGDRIIAVVDDTLARTGLDPGSLVIELTESMMQGAQAHSNLVALRMRGILIAIDDFGTGFSSLAYLRRFPVDVLKIDRSFLTGLPHDDKDGAIVRTIIAMARNLELTVVAEGVETHAQLEFLRELGCDEAQGFLLSHPLDTDAFSRRFCADTSKPAADEVA
jgi:diguanylate cyclase (GGDEF)-like protein